MDNQKYDLLVIGGGSGGVRAARLAATAGMKVAIVEKSYWGGTCVNVGCVPKKLMKYAAGFGREFIDAKEYGWNIGAPNFNWHHFIRRKDTEIERLNKIYAAALQRAGADIFWGQAKIVGPHSVKVDGQQLNAKRILIATGGRPFVPDITGSEFALSSDQIFHLEDQPKRILIIGGGFIALEFGAIFRGLGSDVIQIYRGDLFLRGFDHDLREHMATELAHQNVDQRFNLDINRIEKLSAGELLVSLSDGSQVEVDQVFFATGRKPNIDGLWSADVDVDQEKSGAIKVDKNFRTSVESIYAIGDVVGRMALTPVAITEAKELVRHWLEGHEVEIDYRAIPQAVFSSPSIATVGYTEEEATAAGFSVEVYEAHFRTLKDSLTSKPDKTYIKMIVEKQSRKVLGVHMLGEDVAEILQTAAVAVNMGATKEDFDRTVAIHPTTAEELVTLNRVRKD